jgi:hypothetical protein
MIIGGGIKNKIERYEHMWRYIRGVLSALLL